MITLTASVLLLVITLGMVPLLKVDFLGSTGQNTLNLTQTFEDGTDLETISAGAEQVEDALLEVDGVEDVMLTAGTGGGMLAMMAGGGATATFIVNTSEDADQAALKEDVRTTLEELDAPGEVEITDAAAGMGGLGGTVDVVVTAQDEAELADAAADVFASLEDTAEHRPRSRATSLRRSRSCR